MPNSNWLTTCIMKSFDYLLMFTQNIQKYISYTNVVKIKLKREKQNKTVFLEPCSVVIFIYNNGML